MPRRTFTSVLVTGASRGIGAALAERYAREGAALALVGRNPRTLEEVAARCRAAGAPSVFAAAVDVREHGALSEQIGEADRRHPIELLIANAGVTGGWSRSGAAERPEDSRRLLDINIVGAVNAVHAVLPHMQARGFGQIALLSSIAAFVPLPGVPSYCASKAAVLAYALSLRETVRRDGIGVSAVCPGYVDTQLMRRLSGPRPTMISPTAAAETIFRGLERDKRIIAFPTLIATLSRLIGALPEPGPRLLLPRLTVAPPEEG